MDKFLNIRGDDNLLHAQQPHLGANANFKLKPALISLVSRQLFAGEDGENPHHHLRAFNRVAASVRIAGVDQNVISFMLFPFSLTGEAKDWWVNQDLATWEEGCRNFLKTYFPTSLIVQLRAEITGFELDEKGTLLEGWNRYKELLKACPNVGMDNWLQVFTFYNGMPDDIKNNLDAAAGGSLTSKTATEARNLIEVMAQNRN